MLVLAVYDIGLVIQHINDTWPRDEDSQCLLVIMWSLIVGDLHGGSMLRPQPAANATSALTGIILYEISRQWSHRA